MLPLSIWRGALLFFALYVPLYLGLQLLLGAPFSADLVGKTLLLAAITTLLFAGGMWLGARFRRKK